MAPGENELGIMQGESGAIRAGIVGVDLHCCFRFVSQEGAEEFFRLALQLIEVGMRMHPPGG